MKNRDSSTRKKVIAETRKGEAIQGYVNLESLDSDDGLNLLDSDGQSHEIKWKSLKILWFVQDWEEDPTQPQKVTFQRRPRIEGLWIRLTFRDDSLLEGVLVNDLQQVNQQGYLLTPPSFNGNHTTAFVPRAALKSVKVLSVIGAPTRRKSRRRAPIPGQSTLFDT